MKTITDLLREHSFFTGLSEADLALLGGCGQNRHYRPGQCLARENDPADEFYLIRAGRVAIETHTPNGRPLRLLTLAAGDILGWSWLFPPYVWRFDVQVLDSLRVVALNGKCLRQKCEQDPRLGYDLMKRFAGIMSERLQATRLQMMDIYCAGLPEGSTP